MAKKAAAKPAPTAGLNAFYNDVARIADTTGLQISVADTKRVLACFFDVLATLPSDQAMDVVGKGLKLASKRASKSSPTP
jgi:hypothetical protein